MRPAVKKRPRAADLEKIANRIREDIIRMLVEAGSGHSAGPLDLADVFSALYFRVLRHDPKRPDWPERDRLFLSNGHVAPVVYAALANAGYFPRKELQTLRKFGTRLQGHVDRSTPGPLAKWRGHLPGIESTAASLAQGIGISVGTALAGVMDKKKWQVYCVTSDGEHDEGSFWEAIMFAGNRRLWNLTIIVDRNNIQIDGMTEDVAPLEPLRAKYEAFKWRVIDVDGHNIEAITDACNEAKAIYEKPVAIIAHTIAGKGVHFMEYDYQWHGKPPDQEQAKQALRDIRSLRGQIVGEHE